MHHESRASRLLSVFKRFLLLQSLFSLEGRTQAAWQKCEKRLRRQDVTFLPTIKSISLYELCFSVGLLVLEGRGVIWYCFLSWKITKRQARTNPSDR